MTQYEYGYMDVTPTGFDCSIIRVSTEMLPRWGKSPTPTDE